jgi:hypothetical protein
MNGFISYAHADYDAFELFLKAVSSAARHFGVVFWSDPVLHTGQHWNQAIAGAIASADVFVALVSFESLYSKYINDDELPAIQARSNATGALILPVVLNRCLWEYKFAAIQVAPTRRGRLIPIATWRPKQDGFVAAAEQTTDAIRRFYKLPPGSSGP